MLSWYLPVLNFSPLIKNKISKTLKMLIGQGHQEVMTCKGYATKYKMLFTFIYLSTLCTNTFAHLKIGWSDTKGAYIQSSLTHLRCKYQEIKAEILNSCLMFIFLSQPQMYLVYCKKKGIGLAVPILLKGTVY